MQENFYIILKTTMQEKECVSYCICEKYKFKDVFLYLNEKYKIKKYQNAILLEHKEENEVCFIFDYGVIVSWNLSHTFIEGLIEEIHFFEVERDTEMLTEHLTYVIQEDKNLRIYDDCMFLQNDDNEIKLALSQ